jgi:anti-sigma regulatory factor (Ser/Thr protein kinase)
MGPEDDEASGVVAQQHVTDLSCLDVPATSDRLSPLRHALTEWATTTGMSDDQVNALVLAADEAMSNVVSHAYPQRPGTLDLVAQQRPDQGKISVTVRDRGHWRPVREDPGPLHGRGLLLIRALAQDVAIERESDGTTVKMSWSDQA